MTGIGSRGRTRLVVMLSLVAALAAFPSAATPKAHVTPKSGSYVGHTTQTDSKGRHAGVRFSFSGRTLHNFLIQFRATCRSGHPLYAQLGIPQIGPIPGPGVIGHPRSTSGPVTLFDNTQGVERSSYFLAVLLVGANKITGQFQAHTRLFNASGRQVDDCRMAVASWSATRQTH